MEFLDRFLLAPDENHLLLLRYLLVLAFFIHLPYIGVVIGGTLSSLVLNVLDRDNPNPKYGRLAYNVMELAVPSKVIVLVLGILPMFVLAMIYWQWFYHSTVATLQLFAFGVVVSAAGFVPIFAYARTIRPGGQNSLMNLALGGAGLFALILGYYVMLGSIARFYDPERWHLAHNAIRWMISWNLIWKFHYFLASAVAVTGGALLFFTVERLKRQVPPDPEYTGFVKNFGAGIAIGSIVLVPVFGFFYLLTTPEIAMSGAVFLLGAISIFLLFVAFAHLYQVISSGNTRRATYPLVIFLAVFLMMVFGDQLNLVNATKEHSAKLITEAHEREIEEKMKRQAGRAVVVEVSMERGEEVFKSVCSTCHRFDEKLVGPALVTVLPKYKDRMDELVDYIRKPSKKNPEYPPMPALGLPPGDIRSVAGYVMNELDRWTSGEVE
jgi:cytochrome c